MNDLTEFTFDTNTIRVITNRSGEILFVAKDVATALGYLDTDQAVRNHCKYMILLKPVELTGLGFVNPPPRGLTFIPESDVYRLTMRSQLDSAGRFQDWVCEDVLPSIRKTGGYQPQQTGLFTIERESLSLVKLAVEAAEAFGFKGNQALLSADKAVRNITGISPLALMEHTHLAAPKQEQLLTVTDLGARVGMSAQETNLALTQANLQSACRDLKGKLCYELTEEGEQYGVYLDTGKSHSDGTPVKQLKWYSSVLGVLQ